MPTKIVVPDLGESVIDATVAEWLKQEGESVAAGETVVILETDKVSLEVGAESDGILARIEQPAGADVKIGAVLGLLEAGASGSSTAADDSRQLQEQPPPEQQPSAAKERVSPVARRMAEEHAVDPAQVMAEDGARVTKKDVQRHLERQETAGTAPASAPGGAKPASPVAAPKAEVRSSSAAPAEERSVREERRPMSRRRQTIARRLLEAQQSAAMLTTFNEVDMQAVMALRARRREAFKAKYGVSLGLSSFFVKAAIGALKAYPLLNAEIQGNEIVRKQYYDIGIAIGAEEGLVVPVLRDADRLSFAEIEQAVRSYAQQSEAGKLSIESLRGGTFTITNGGVFGSMLSTPILNPPQVGILGLHAIKDRATVIDGQIAVRPIMYVALTYDHRIVDGREAVQFLVRIKELIEDPEVLLLEG